MDNNEVVVKIEKERDMRSSSEQASSAFLSLCSEGPTPRLPRKRVYGPYSLEISKGILYLVHRTKATAGGFASSAFGRNRTPVPGLPVTCTVVAMRMADGTVIGNSSILPTIGRYVTWGTVHDNHAITLIQRLLEADVRVSMLPLVALEQASLRLTDVKVLEHGAAESVQLNRRTIYEGLTAIEVVPRHFTGAILLKVRRTRWLFDIDRNEIKHGIFNPFMAQLPRSSKATTVEQAYRDLIPARVKAAMAKGKKVRRQGEWFFVPCKAPRGPNKGLEIKVSRIVGWSDVARAQDLGMKVSRYRALRDKSIHRISLQVGNNRPNTVSKGVVMRGKTYASGTVSHTGREHKDMLLKGWYEAIPNTASKSVTVTGDVD